MQNEKSLENIWKRVNVHHSRTDKEEKQKVFIAKTLQRLPYKVRNEILTNVTFLYCNSRGFIDCLFFTSPIKKSNNLGIKIEKPIIVLNFKKMKRGEEQDTIAHEIAHIHLKHYYRLGDGRIEREADNLVKKWKFKKRYTKKQYKEFEKNATRF